jgi:23S rRNA pseudouridine1911/1915/1917 synthase
VRKPAGLPTMPGGRFLENTLLHLVRTRYDDQLAPLHRLGRATSGIVLFARSTAARRCLSADLREGRLRKVYRALVQGVPTAPAFVVDVPIGPVPYAPLGQVHAATRLGVPSRSLVRVLEQRRARDQTLVEVEIPTGRPHQIRIHLAAAGHPLAGDPLYAPGGTPMPLLPGCRPPLPGDGGYLLHACRVELVHPVRLTPLVLVCPPPALLRTATEAQTGSDQ